MAEERERSELFRVLERSLGEEAASAIMERLPPSPWTHIARQEDLADLRAHMDTRFAAVDERFERVEERIGAVDERVGAVEERMGAVEERIGGVEGRFGILEERLTADAALREERVTSALRGEMNTLISTQTRTIAFTLLGAITAHSLALIAAVRL